MIVETVRVSQQGKDQLSTLKRKTGIQNWNILCRWALCSSLAEKSVPPQSKIVTDSPIEIAWKTFTGDGMEEAYDALIRQRCKNDGLDSSKEGLAEQFKLHLHRGLGYLSANNNLKTTGDLLAMICPKKGICQISS
jgi:DNA sulfur modification protein DndE